MDGNRIRSIIDSRAWEAESEADVRVILTNLLNDVQWGPHLKLAAQRRAEAEEANRAFWEKPVPCERCGKEIPLSEAASHAVADIRYCVRCSEIVRERYKRQCLYCGITYSVGGINEYPGLCKACWREDWAKEGRRLYVQIERTKKLDLPAQLSLKNLVGHAGVLQLEVQALFCRHIRADRGIFLIAHNEHRVMPSYTAGPVWHAEKGKNKRRRRSLERKYF